jgi:hypothetical protein
MFRRIFFALLTLPFWASAETLPNGSFTLQKGQLGCPVLMQIEENAKCSGFTMRDLNEKTDTEFCNINNGKYLKRWKEGGIEFFSESKATRSEKLVHLTEIRKAKKNSIVLRRSKTETNLFYRSGRLEVQRNKDGRGQSCIYRREMNFPVSASNQQ